MLSVTLREVMVCKRCGKIINSQNGSRWCESCSQKRKENRRRKKEERRWRRKKKKNEKLR